MEAKQIGLIITVVAALGGAAAFLTWLENRKSRALREKVLGLDKQIKELELARLKSQLST